MIADESEATSGLSYPRVLICALSRVNNDDTFNNNLLLRNLFADWPRERLAQIFSGGSNGDKGFCGHQYQIGPDDRRFGKLFFRLKGEYADTSQMALSTESDNLSATQSATPSLKQRAGRFLMDSGLYELLFKLRTSQQLLVWAETFEPDIILAQGYNLTFTWLPLVLKKKLKKPLAFYNSDDWPSYLYGSRKGLCAITAPLMRRLVCSSTQQLLDDTDTPFSFNDMMGEEYQRRYGKNFTTLMHCDDPKRFICADVIRLSPQGVKSIVTAGAFWASRWPQLLDLEEVSRRLDDLGISVHTTVIASRISPEGLLNLKKCRYITVIEDPGHEKLPSYLKGADLLFIPETFDPIAAEGYRYSISTKAHLFMFSKQPILIYGHSACGLVKYARREGWAYVVDQRNVDMLETAVKELLTVDVTRNSLVQISSALVMRNNNCYEIRKLFRDTIVKTLTAVKK